MGRGSVAVVLALALLVMAGVLLPACRPVDRGRSRGDMAIFGAEPQPEFIEDSFESMYPVFLRRKVGQGPKAALWASHFHRRWVRWVGRIRSFTPNGITLRMLPFTSTFDVSLWLNNDERDAIHARYKVGDIVTYMGRLDSYDDVWRTMYLVNGSVLGTGDARDAGL